MQDVHLSVLTDLYIAGVLSAHERRELHYLLLQSEHARAQFDRQIEEHLVLHPDANLTKSQPLLSGWNEEQAEQPVPVHAELSNAFRLWCLACALVTCGIAILIVGLWPRSIPVFEPPMAHALGAETHATLRHAASVQWLDVTNEIFRGHPFGGAPIQIAAGAIELEFKSGARLVLEGPASLQLLSSNEAFLHSGKATAHVPDTAHGFKITAPSVAVTDLGTEFGVSATSNAPAEVHVFSGLVELARPEAPPKLMTQGKAARIQRNRFRDVPVNRSGFLMEKEMIERETAEMSEQFRRWKHSAREISADAAALVHYTFENQPASSSRLANYAFSSVPPIVGSVTGCIWSEGRWPQKRAVVLNGGTDRIRFSVPNTLTSLTYMAWLRVDQLLNLSNALAITETMQKGEVHWQMYKDGRVALSAHSGDGPTVDQSWDRGLSPAIFTADRMGKWTHLVSVYDSQTRTINHYLNGEFISSTPIKRLLPLRLGAVEIGNWGVQVNQPQWASMKKSSPSYLNRQWKGSIDEFALLGRAMKPEEIRRYYQNGRVSTGSILAKAVSS